MTALAQLVERQTAKLRAARADNRARFTAAAELKDLFAAQGMDGAIVYAENVSGETIGKLDAGPFVDWTLIARAKAWNDRVYGRDGPRMRPEPHRMSREGRAHHRQYLPSGAGEESLIGLPRRF